jgi:hypothetical protein
MDWGVAIMSVFTVAKGKTGMVGIFSGTCYAPASVSNRRKGSISIPSNKRGGQAQSPNGQTPKNSTSATASAMSKPCLMGIINALPNAGARYGLDGLHPQTIH